MGAIKDLISLILFVASLLVLYKTTNHLVSLLIVITIALYYVIKHFKLNNFLKKELKMQIQTLEKLFNTSSDILMYLDRDINVIACNDAIYQNLGIKKKDILGCNLKNIIKNNSKTPQKAEEKWKKLESKLREVISSHKSVTYYEDFTPITRKSLTYFNMLIFPTFSSNSEINGLIVVARNVTEEYSARLSASEKEKQLKCILENMPLCAYMKDKNDNFIVGSSIFEKFVNCQDREEVQQLSLQDVYEEDYIKVIKKEETNIYKNKKMISTERQIVLPNQSFWGRVRKVPVIDSNGEVQYLVVMYENIESEKEIEKQKEYFIETLIHDLKIPTLAQLRGLELLQQETMGAINKNQHELISEIEDSCKYILNMISMVLNTYRFENGQNKLYYEKFSMAELLLECFREISSLAQEKNITFAYTATLDNTDLDADRKEIKKVIINLLSNAIVYSGKNEKINVYISTEHNNLKFSISSRGIRLSEEECITLFDKFKTNSTHKYSTIGHGIGLYLCKKIIDVHNGKIFASTDGVQTNTFTFVLPQHRPELKPQKGSPLFI